MKNQKYSYSYIKNYIEEFGCSLLSKEYKNTKEKMEIIFSCGHKHKMSFECFIIGQRCPCGAKEKFKSTVESKTRAKVLSFSKSIGFTIISFENGFASWDGNLSYICPKGHIETRGVREFMDAGSCKKCTRVKVSESQKGSLGSNWMGGKTRLSKYFRKSNLDWKKESMKQCDYKCVITGERFDDIHHLKPVSSILDESLFNLNLPRKGSLSEYTESESNLIVNEVLVVQKKYPLGVCLRKDIHKRFHKEYGLSKCTENDFYDFIHKIQLGIIIIS